MKPAAVGLSIGLFMFTLTWAQQPDRGTTSVELDTGKVIIEYGTPVLGDRNLEALIMPNWAWRMGMNTTTTLETTVALDFGFGRKLQPGKYALFARPDKYSRWTLLASSVLTSSVLDPSTVVMDVPIYLTKDEEPQDPLKITLEKSGLRVLLIVAWGTYRLRCSLRAAI